MSHIVFAAWNGDSTLPFVKLHIAGNMHTVSKVQKRNRFEANNWLLHAKAQSRFQKKKKYPYGYTSMKRAYIIQCGVHSLKYHGNLNDKFIKFQTHHNGLCSYDIVMNIHRTMFLFDNNRYVLLQYYAPTFQSSCPLSIAQVIIPTAINIWQIQGIHAIEEIHSSTENSKCSRCWYTHRYKKKECTTIVFFPLHIDQKSNSQNIIACQHYKCKSKRAKSERTSQLKKKKQT